MDWPRLGQADRYAVSAGININLWWGLAMLLFGVTLLLLARRAPKRSVRAAGETPEGRATEEREHARGLEH